MNVGDFVSVGRVCLPRIKTYKWDRIQTVDDFVKGENRENIYHGAVLDVKTSSKLTDEALNEMQLILPSDYNGQGYEIYRYAFYGCADLTSVTMGSGVTSIGYSALDGCSKLKRIDFNGTKAQWEAIRKGSNWNRDTGSCTIYCTNGTI